CRSYQRVDLRFPVEDCSRLIHSGGTSRSWLISRHLRPGGFRRPVMHHVFRRRTGRVLKSEKVATTTTTWLEPSRPRWQANEECVQMVWRSYSVRCSQDRRSVPRPCPGGRGLA